MVASTAVRLKKRMFERLIAGILEEDTILQRLYQIRRTTGHPAAIAVQGGRQSAYNWGKKVLRYCEEAEAAYCAS